MLLCVQLQLVVTERVTLWLCKKFRLLLVIGWLCNRVTPLLRLVALVCGEWGEGWIVAVG